MVGQERLVRGDHVLAGGERSRDEGARGLEASDQLDHDVDRRVPEHPGGVARQRQRREIKTLARAGEVGVGDRGQSETSAGALLQHLASALEDLRNPGPDGAEPQQTDAHVARAAHGSIPAGSVSGSAA